MNRETRFNRLIESYLDRRLEDTELFELEEFLNENPKNRRRFMEQAGFEGLLREWGRERSGCKIIMPAKKPSSIWTFASATLGVAAVLILCAMLWGLIGPTGRGELDGGKIKATLIHQEDATWAPGTTSPALGKPVSTGSFTLASGRAGFSFEHGRTLTLGAPSTIVAISATLLRCNQGILSIFSADPLAPPLSVDTPSGRLVLRHGAIGIRVTPEDSLVFVQSGGASIILPDGVAATIAEGGARIFGRGVANDMDLSLKESFLRQLRDDRTFLRRVVKPNKSDLTKSDLLDDPDLLVQFTFDDIGGPGSRIKNHSGYGESITGTLVGGRTAPGMSTSDRAIDLRQKNDGVTLAVPGTYQTITMAAWIRVDKLDNEYNGLLMSDGIQPGGFHWQIRQHGSLEVGVLEGVSPSYDSPPVFTGKNLGTWQHVAVVYDLPSNSIAHYHNGHLIQRSSLSVKRLVKIRTAVLGNWNPADDWDPQMIRNFNGRIDEFLIYQRSLTDQEIRNLYESGKP